MAVTAAEVKALRDETGAGMMDCKQALTEAGGDVEQAKAILRQKGKAKGAKREGKATAEGGVAAAAAPDGSTACVVELQCETDFVARSEAFRSLAEQVAAKVLERGAGDPGSLGLSDSFDEALSRLGEKLVIGHIARYEASPGGVVATYLHTATNRLGVVIELGVDGVDPAAAMEVGRELAMQAAAMRPDYVTEADVPAERVEAEKNVLRGAADLAGKPAEIQERIIEGRLKKGFYEQVCLLCQPFARDDDKTTAQWLAERAKALGGKLTVRRFERVEVGRE